MSVPYRVDLRHAVDHAFDRLVELGALDAEVSHDGAIAALMPDSVAPFENDVRAPHDDYSKIFAPIMRWLMSTATARLHEYAI